MKAYFSLFFLRGGPLNGCSAQSRVDAMALLPERTRLFRDGYYAKARQLTAEAFNEIVGVVEYEWIST